MMKNIILKHISFSFGAALIASLAVPVAFAQSPLLTTEPISQVQSTDPTRPATTPPFTPQEQALVGQMRAVIATSQVRGSLNVGEMNRVYAAAFAAQVQPEVIGQMVADLVQAFPSSISTIAGSAIAPAQGRPSMELVYQVMNSAIMASPRPFANVLVVRDSVARMINMNAVLGMDEYIKYATARIASATPDNPMNSVAYGKRQIGTEREQQGLARKMIRGGTMLHGVLMHEVEVGLNPFFVLPEPVSPPSGSVSGL